jgi:hypothetical protein
MRNPTPLALLAAGLLSTGLLSACATGGEALPMPRAADGSYLIPEDAVEAVRTESNGDVVHEYRVQGQLRMVKVVPARGPTYYLVDRNGDGKVNPEDGEQPATYYKLFSW